MTQQPGVSWGRGADTTALHADHMCSENESEVQGSLIHSVWSHKEGTSASSDGRESLVQRLHRHQGRSNLAHSNICSYLQTHKLVGVSQTGMGQDVASQQAAWQQDVIEAGCLLLSGLVPAGVPVHTADL